MYGKKRRGKRSEFQKAIRKGAPSFDQKQRSKSLRHVTNRRTGNVLRVKSRKKKKKEKGEEKQQI